MGSETLSHIRNIIYHLPAGNIFCTSAMVSYLRHQSGRFGACFFNGFAIRYSLDINFAIAHCAYQYGKKMVALSFSIQ